LGLEAANPVEVNGGQPGYQARLCRDISQIDALFMIVGVFSAGVRRPVQRVLPEGWPTLHGMAFDQRRCLCRDYAGERETGVRQKRAEIRFRTLATADH
jgi:hypothetical protein